MNKVKKVIILGSGALKIGEAGEFDYSGSQAIKVLKAKGIKTVLVNPNIATIQTSWGMADQIYFLPVQPYFVKQVIKKERPDGILLGFGGQTALNCGVELYQLGILKEYQVKVLGTPIQSIINTEDRGLFVRCLKQINIKVPRSRAVTSIAKGLQAAKKIGYPVMVRSAYTLGGLGSGISKNKTELKNHLQRTFAYTHQALIEECLAGWKEIEFEVVRDKYDNCITVCNMENFDPMGIHTGESIVVAPAQTLTNQELQFLRALSIKIIRHLKIIGECNIQFAFDPNSFDYRVIEVNARLSRSSALASKATGYPLAAIAAKLALGYSLTDIPNTITKITKACFEPALDYIVIKIPRWDLKKFKAVSPLIGSGMKSVGEVMAIGRNFEEAIQKAIRMLGTGMHGLVANRIEFININEQLKNPTDQRLLAIAYALQHGYSVNHIYQLTKIDRFFLYKIRNVINTTKKLEKNDLTPELLLLAKKQGFSDFQIARLSLVSRQRIDMHQANLKIRKLRQKWQILPKVKQIDTLAAEFPAKTNYLYLTYNAINDDIDFKKKKTVIVLGSGTYRIGSSVEFDWCAVNSVLTLNKLGYQTLMINYNPETVSTDYDICQRLYFEELSFERVMDIYDKEKPRGVIISMGGQIPNNLAMRLYKSRVKILGTSPLSIDRAENRYKFSQLLEKLNIDQPEWKELITVTQAIKFAHQVGYPVLVRPSYVLSGAAMKVAFNNQSLKQYLQAAAEVSKEHPVVISKFITHAKEIELDGVAKKGRIINWAISEHIENAGVHSGDATMVYPPQRTYHETIRRIRRLSEKIAQALKITGPFNIQYIAKNNWLKVIECNLRASRSFPFVSKISNINFIEQATRAIAGRSLLKKESTLDLKYLGIKSPQFSFSRLRGADPTLGVEMASTGEVACLSHDVYDAFLKSLLAVGLKLPEKNVLISIGGERNRYDFLNRVELLKELGFNIYATEHNSEFLTKHGIENQKVAKISEIGKPDNIKDYLINRKFDLMIMVRNEEEEDLSADHYQIRRLAVDLAIPLITNLQVAKLLVNAIAKYKLEDLETLAWIDYLKESEI